MAEEQLPPSTPKECARPSRRRSRFLGFEDWYDDIGVRRWSLEFSDPKTEAAFALQFGTHFAHGLFLCGSVLFSVAGVFLLFRFDGSDVQLLANVDEVSWCAFSALMWVGAGAGLVSLAQLRWSVFGVRAFEIIVVTLGAIAILVIPLTDRTLSFTLLGRLEDAQRAKVFFTGNTYLSIDCVVTMATLLSFRWSSMWSIYVLGVLWSPVLRLTVMRSFEGHLLPQLTLGSLTILAGIGKRASEGQSRRLFHAIALERTMRAESEFRLEQRASDREVVAPSSGGRSSLDTASIFNESVAMANLEVTFGLVQRVARQEHWLIQPHELRVHATQSLGQGGCGVVMAGSMNGLPVAVKLSIGQVRAEAARHTAMLVSELRVFRKLRHPNISMFFGAVVDVSLLEIALVMELVVGPRLDTFVKTHMQSRSDLRHRQTYSLLCGIARALRYLHSQNPCIVHGDLKPTNILVDNAESVSPSSKLVDFGLSRVLAGKVSPLGGTLRWMAPEQLNGHKPSPAVDVFGFGQVSFFVITGAQPFLDMPHTEIRDALTSGEVPTPTFFHDSSPLVEQVADIAEECICPDPSGRPTMGKVCERLLYDTASIEELDVVKHNLWIGDRFGRKLRCELGEPPPSEEWSQVIPWLKLKLRQASSAQVGAMQSLATPGPPLGFTLEDKDPQSGVDKNDDLPKVVPSPAPEVLAAAAAAAAVGWWSQVSPVGPPAASSTDAPRERVCRRAL